MQSAAVLCQGCDNPEGTQHLHFTALVGNTCLCPTLPVGAAES